MQICRICRTEKPLGEFYFRKEGTPRRHCKSCQIERQRYRKNGVCNARYDEILVQQSGACAVCCCTLNSSRYSKLAVDHDHRTGKVRGLLCTNCNTALGLMKDSPRRLRAAAAYLEKHSSKEIVSSGE
jgi:hypothetical protein